MTAIQGRAALGPSRLHVGSATTVTRLTSALMVALGSALLLTGCGPVPETSWSPNDTGIAYCDNGRLRIFDVQTRQSRLLDTGPGRVVSPSWSPDGSAIAFYSIVQGNHPIVSLCAIDPANGQVRTLASDVWPLPTKPTPDQAATEESPEKALEDAQNEALIALVLWGTIAWSPDSARLACVAASASGGAILLVDSATCAAAPIATDTNALGMAAWSPDGRRLAYLRAACPPVEQQSGSGRPPGVNTVYVYDLAAGGKEKVCELPEDIAPVPGTRFEWSGDSTQIGFIESDKHHEDRGVACTVKAIPDAAVRAEMRGITPVAAWSPGLAGVVFIEQREGNQWVLIYRGVRPRARQVLGALPLQSNDQDDWFSLPQFSHNGRKVALRVGSDPFPVNVEVFEVK